MKWFFSKTINKYVCLQPVSISARVSEAAQNAGITLDWDDCGYIINLSFEEARKLAGCLQGQIMTPSEYWKVFKEAEKEGRTDVIASLSSNVFTEFLNRVYVGEGQYIDDPFVKPDYEYVGTVVNEEITVGRPGWIMPEDMDENTGHPVRVREKSKTVGLIKYWSPDLSVTKYGKCFAVRGYVTSVATMSLDLGIPVDSRQPKLMLRIVTKEKPADYIDEEKTSDAEKLLEENDFYKLEEYRNSDEFKKLRKAADFGVCEIAERLYFNLGQLRLMKKLPCLSEISYEDMCDYVFTLHCVLKEAIEDKKQIIFVCGHRNPDTDTVISSLFEAYRLSIENTDENRVILPLIQSDIMPAEIARLLGEDIYPELLYETDADISALLETGRVRIVFTDQNYQADIQKYVIGITDHHVLNSEYTPRDNRPCIDAMVGSCTALVVTKYMGLGYSFDKKLSKLIYGAMLMDTENRVCHKVTGFDSLIMDKYKEQAGVKNDSEFYSELMSELISETDIATLYYRDYKSYKGFGFSSIKVYDFIDKECFPRKIKKFKEIAAENNIRFNYYLTLIKLVEYEKGGLKVSRERLYYVFNDTADANMRKQVVDLIENISRHFLDEAKVERAEGYIEISESGRQLSRKKIAPAIESLIEGLSHYVFVSAIGKYVARDFLTKNSAIDALGIPVSYDKKERVCNLTYPEAKKLAEGLGMEIPDLKEFWQIYAEAVTTGNRELVKSLSDEEFIEYIDTVSVDGELIYRPKLSENEIVGDKVRTNIIPATPGLISPKEISMLSGLPVLVHSPAEYKDKSLWRYWSPINVGTFVFTRSYIFLIGQACLDAKMSMDEGFSNLGLRLMSVEKPADRVWTEITDTEVTIWYKSAFETEGRVIFTQRDFRE